eukprot:6389305-Prymnesium_polylepis.2
MPIRQLARCTRSPPQRNTRCTRTGTLRTTGCTPCSRRRPYSCGQAALVPFPGGTLFCDPECHVSLYLVAPLTAPRLGA